MSITKRAALVGTLMAAFVASAASPTAPARADDLDFDSVCGPVMNQATTESQKTNSDLAQKLEYCQAAKSSTKGANADGVLWKVWAGVAVVCTAACVAPMISAVSGGEYVCMGTNAAGAVTDAIVTKNFASALYGIVSAGGTYLANSMAGTGHAASGASKKPDTGSCLSAAAAAVQSYSKYSSMRGEEKTAKASLESAQAVTSDSASVSTASAANGSGTDGSTGQGTTSNGTSTASADTADSVSSTCASAKSTGSYAAYISCAVASDSTLPSFVKSPRFADELKNTTGSLPDFFNKADNPTATLGAGMGTGLNTLGASKLSAALQEAQVQVESVAPGSIYARGGGGGGAGSGGGGDDLDIGALMQGALSGLLPQNAEKPSEGIRAVAFANQKRGPNSIAEDKSLSIFDRVTFRYLFVGKRMAPGRDGK